MYLYTYTIFIFEFKNEKAYLRITLIYIVFNPLCSQPLVLFPVPATAGTRGVKGTCYDLFNAIQRLNSWA